ncbi:asparagine synthase-domain-containing protein [Xylariaceae sp. FL0255]|nr:asparagine synthase-domain-containing protein [Xylariaceae sp. FL0255]
MCGIHVVLSSHSPQQPPSDDLIDRLRSRGPDHLGSIVVHVGPSAQTLTCTSTVLALRGNRVTAQPFHNPQTGCILCWNGEAWRIAGRQVEGNDGESIFGLLAEAGASGAAVDVKDSILDALRSIEGPFAFAYFHHPSQTLFFARDRLGRRSLLSYQDEASGTFMLSSVSESCDLAWKEVELDGIYHLSLSATADTSLAVSRSGWQADSQSDFVSGIGVFNMSEPPGAACLTTGAPSVLSLRQQLTESLRLRVRNIPRPPMEDDNRDDTRVAVLFSGGLDCSVLVRLTHELLGDGYGIDLLNVAFENPRVVAQLKKEARGGPVNPYEVCPDRITGRKSFEDLQRLCPGRRIRFVAVDVPYSETLAHRKEVVSLMYPNDTAMDLWIAYALYFAARGQGLCVQAGAPEAQYTTPARVLLSGLGADELFGGYARHATAFSRQGYVGLANELKLDIGLVGKRNMGRDDRIMAHWGKGVRFPYLDERLVRWAIEAPTWEKCDFANGEDISGVESVKRVLRLLALELGLDGAAREKKRAIQFGARTAKMETSKETSFTKIS